MSILASLSIAALLGASDLSALVATKVIPAGQTISTINAETVDGAIPSRDILGREVRRTVYVGQKINFEDTQAPRIVSRNQVVTVKYLSGSLEITTAGRAMNDAAVNETVAVMNTTSRQLINGTVQSNGTVIVQ